MQGEFLFEPHLKLLNDDSDRRIVGIWYSWMPEYRKPLGCVMFNFEGQTNPNARWYESFTGSKVANELILRSWAEGGKVKYKEGEVAGNK